MHVLSAGCWSPNNQREFRRVEGVVVENWI